MASDFSRRTKYVVATKGAKGACYDGISCLPVYHSIYEIRPGDLAVVYDEKVFKSGGPVLRYTYDRKRYAKGPAWGPEQETLKWEEGFKYREQRLAPARAWRQRRKALATKQAA